jgi:hypothetical protein
MPPSTGVHLVTASGTVTARYKEVVLEKSTSPDLSPILYPLDVRELLFEQNSIGWGQLFSGRFCIEWTKIQKVYYSRHRQKEAGNQRRDGLQWQVKLIVLMWDP